MDFVRKVTFSVFLIALKYSSEVNAASSPQIYTAVSPPFIYPHSDYTISVFVEPGQAETSIEFSAEVTCGQFVHQSKPTNANEISTAKLGPKKLIIPVKQIEGSSCNLTLITTQAGAAPTKRSAPIQIGSDDFILIHTDKSIYKPNDIVQFRVILLDRHGKPKSGTVDVRIRDSNRNVVKLWRSVATDSFGVLRDKLELSYEPNLGEWQIDANTVVGAKKVGFKVQEYVLPKVDVKVQIPEYGVITEFQPVPITVKAKYTFGEAVKGICEVAVSLFSTGCEGNSRQSLLLTSFPIDGIASQSLNLGESIDGIKNGSQVEFRVKVTEDLTGKQFTKEMVMPLFTYPFQIRPVEKMSYHRHGLPFLIDFQILDRKNQLIKNSRDTVTIKHNFEEGVTRFPIPVIDGIVHCNFTETSGSIVERFIEVKYNSFAYRYVVPERKINNHKVSMIKDSLVIELNQASSTDQIIKFVVKSTASLQFVNYLIVSYQEIVSLSTVQLQSSSKRFSLNISIPEDLSSDATLFVFTYINQDYIGDFVSIRNVQKSSNPQNFLKLFLSNEKLEPGKNLSITIQAKPASMIALRAVDQSVLLLADDSDLNRNALEEEYRLGSFQSGNQKPFDLRKSGIVVLTNAKESQDFIYRFYQDPLEEICFEARGDSEKTESESVVSISGDVDVHRSYFPETWIWEEILMNNSATSSHNFKVPDTLTSWVITGYSINPQFGIGFLPQPQQLTTFKQFFITVDLPYSVVQGEQLLLKILIHNYIPGTDNRRVSVQINDLKDEFLVGKARTQNNEKSVDCSPNSACSVTFPITPSRIGQIVLDIRARTANGGDAILQPLLVIPSGEKVTATESKVFQDSNSDADGSPPRFKINLPANRVKDGDSIKLSFYSDPLSSAIDHVDNLLELPLGCGEQNMLKFVTNLAILNYLNATKRLTPQVKEKALKFLELGYQRELAFRNVNGSFSTFQTDAIASTWLTAFVIRYFLAARPWISIDDDVIAQGLTFLKSKRVKHTEWNASKFIEEGRMYKSDLLIRNDPDGVKLTAYCALTFWEALKQKFPFDDSYDIFREAKWYWYFYYEGTKRMKKSDAYTDIILTYAEHVWYAGQIKGRSSDVRNDYFKRVQKYERSRDSNLKFLGENENSDVENPAVTVEMTSYMILCYLYREDTAKALPLVRWLVKQQNPNGGFVSTKDTILGLTALAEFAQKTQSPDLNLQVEVSHYENGLLARTPNRIAKITPDNADLFHEMFFPSNTTQVQVKTTGKGTLYVQLTRTYYVTEATYPNSKKTFEIHVEKTEDTPLKLSLKVCTRFIGPGKTEMAIMEVNLPSGYSFDPEALAGLENVTNHKRHELTNKNTKLDIYFDYIPSQGDTCVNVRAIRVFKVGKATPALIRVYDYYEPSRKSLEFYERKPVSYCEICRETQECELANCVN